MRGLHEVPERCRGWCGLARGLRDFSRWWSAPAAPAVGVRGSIPRVGPRGIACLTETPVLRGFSLALMPSPPASRLPPPLPLTRTEGLATATTSEHSAGLAELMLGLPRNTGVFRWLGKKGKKGKGKGSPFGKGKKGKGGAKGYGAWYEKNADYSKWRPARSSAALSLVVPARAQYSLSTPRLVRIRLTPSSHV